MQRHIRGELHADKTIPEPVFAEVVVISGHEMPLNAFERAHVLNRPRQGLLGHLLFFVDVAGNEDGCCAGLDRSLPEGPDTGLTRILQRARDLRVEITKYLADL